MPNLEHREVVAIIADELSKCGWTPVSGGSALASKAFMTNAAEKIAHAYLTSGDEYNRTLQGAYMSEGVNVLGNCSMMVSKDARPEQVRAVAKQFAAGADKNVDGSYARGLWLRHGAQLDAQEAPVRAEAPRG